MPPKYQSIAASGASRYPNGPSIVYSTEGVLNDAGCAIRRSGSAHLFVHPRKPDKMQIQNVVILGNDEALVERALSELTRSGCRISAAAAVSSGDVQMVVRDWRDERRLDDPGVPVLTLDLALITGHDLVNLVDRVLGAQRRSSFTGFMALLMVAHGTIPKA
jgi:hypothetical protein